MELYFYTVPLYAVKTIPGGRANTGLRGYTSRMCGRYTSRFSDERHLAQDLGDIPYFEPRYNIAPQQTAPIIRMVDGKPRFEELRWGFRPAWLKDKNKAQINARAETVFEKPMFKHSALNRRCLVLASGWYEWKKEGPKKQPYLFHLRDDGLFAFAGIWTRWHGENDEYEDNYAIITTSASSIASEIHNRMPVVLNEEIQDIWLNSSCVDVDMLSSTLCPYGNSDLEINPVSQYVNSPRNTSPKCVEFQ